MSSNISEAAEKPNPEFFQLPTHGDPVKDRASNIHFALCELLRLVFEHRELDLGDDETYALNVVTKLLSDLAYIIGDPDGLEDEKYHKAIKELRERFPAAKDGEAQV
jgi:hypothetical protein